MTTYTDRLLLVFPLPATETQAARPAAASLQTLERSGGREFESLTPLDPAAVSEYASGFSLELIVERDGLVTQVTALTAERDDLLTQVTALTDQTDTIPDLQTQIAALTAERDALLARVPPEPGPREVTPAAFLQRFDTLTLYNIWNSDVPIAGIACWTLFTWSGMINLDAPRLTDLLNGLAAAELLTAEEIATILGAA